jgi:hypothetical protein
MIAARILQGLGTTRFSRPLPRTPFGAIIALRGWSCGEGFGACLSCLRQAECRFCPQRRNGYDLTPLRVALRLFPFKINDLHKPQRCNAFCARTYRRARHSCACACAITCATVAALRRCALSLLFLYLPEKKEEKKGNAWAKAATVNNADRCGWRCGLVKSLKSLDLRGF